MQADSCTSAAAVSSLFRARQLPDQLLAAEVQMLQELSVVGAGKGQRQVVEEVDQHRSRPLSFV